MKNEKGNNSSITGNNNAREFCVFPLNYTYLKKRHRADMTEKEGGKAMRKRVVSLLLTAVMCVGLLAGCGGGSDTNTGKDTGNDSGNATVEEGDASTESGDPVELNMIMISMGLNLEDAGKVQDAINEYIQPKINATVNIEWLDMGDYFNQLNLKLTGGEVIDVLPTFGTFVSTLYAQEALMPVTEYLDSKGQGIVEAVGEEYMKAGYIDGELYAIPCIQSFAQNRVFWYRTDLAEQYGLDMSSVKTMEDLTAVFEQLHEADSSLTMIVSNNPNDPMLTTWLWDGLGDEYGVLMDAAGSMEVTNLYETEEYKELVTLMHEWYTKGYIQTDVATTADNMATLLGAGNAFGTIGKCWPGETETQSASCGYELAEIQLVAPIGTTSTVNNAVMTIPSTSENPEKAMEFINLLYTDSTLTNLLYYGIEGEHYQVVDEANGKVDYVEGQDMMTCKYVNKLQIGNQLIGYIESTDPDNLNTEIAEFNEGAEKSKALGFTFDSSSVANQLAALDTVVAKYRRGLEGGSLDPETELPKFIEELKGAGIEDVIAEKQAQLDSWAEANGIN